MQGRAFTLVELMFVVAIIAVLAAVAIPVVSEMQTRARGAEAPVLVEGLTKVASDMTMAGQLIGPTSPGIIGQLDGALNPSATFGKSLRPFDPTMADWNKLGFSPDGAVRCSYGFGAVVYDAGGYHVLASAICDVDGNGSVRAVQMTDDDGARTIHDYCKVGSPPCW